MIQVERIFQQVRELVSKDKGGYLSSAEFNGLSQRSETALFRYYVEMYEMNRAIPEALQPFTIPQVLPVTDGIFGRPADYQYDIFVEFLKSTSPSSCADDVVYETIPVEYLEKSEWLNTKVSQVRAPSVQVGRMYYTWVNSQGWLLPKVDGDINLLYLKYPTYAVRGFVVNVANKEEEEDW